MWPPASDFCAKFKFGISYFYTKISELYLWKLSDGNLSTLLGIQCLELVSEHGLDVVKSFWNDTTLSLFGMAIFWGLKKWQFLWRVLIEIGGVWQISSFNWDEVKILNDRSLISRKFSTSLSHVFRIRDATEMGMGRLSAT